MFSFHTFKDQRYWLLFFPFVVFLILFLFFTSNFLAENPLMIIVFLMIYMSLFWGSYHLWKYVGNQN